MSTGLNLAELITVVLSVFGVSGAAATTIIKLSSNNKDETLYEAVKAFEKDSSKLGSLINELKIRLDYLEKELEKDAKHQADFAKQIQEQLHNWLKDH